MAVGGQRHGIVVEGGIGGIIDHVHPRPGRNGIAGIVDHPTYIKGHATYRRGRLGQRDKLQVGMTEQQLRQDVLAVLTVTFRGVHLVAVVNHHVEIESARHALRRGDVQVGHIETSRRQRAGVGEDSQQHRARRIVSGHKVECIHP